MCVGLEGVGESAQSTAEVQVFVVGRHVVPVLLKKPLKGPACFETGGWFTLLCSHDGYIAIMCTSQSAAIQQRQLLTV